MSKEPTEHEIALARLERLHNTGELSDADYVREKKKLEYEQGKEAGKGCLWVGGFSMLILVILIGSCVNSASKSSNRDEPRDRSVTASRLCREAAANRLKSPSSAEFSGVGTVRDGQSYRVTGVMTGANALGGVVGHDFRCVITVADSGIGSIQSLTVTPR